ncbi:hypothetical protein AB0D59_15415 [Streptomyces sp. NPDC048417]|uniref:hypothetical protein n=1 Tax=Streptomyces sp. NPDC048417 TaxID=3155387 RepID=UPI0034319612
MTGVLLADRRITPDGVASTAGKTPSKVACGAAPGASDPTPQVVRRLKRAWYRCRA